MLAASGIGIGGSIAANATLGGVTYLANCEMEGVTSNPVDLAGTVIIGGLSGAIGGSGVDGARLRGVHSTAKEVLKTTVSPKKVAMYTAKITTVKATIKEGIARTFAAGITSNVLNTAREKVVCK